MTGACRLFGDDIKLVLLLSELLWLLCDDPTDVGDACNATEPPNSYLDGKSDWPISEWFVVAFASDAEEFVVDVEDMLNGWCMLADMDDPDDELNEPN